MSAGRKRSRLSVRGRWGLGLLAVGVVGMVTISALPFLWRNAIAEAIAERRLELRLIESRLSAEGSGTRTRLTNGDDIASLFVPGATSGLAMAELQGLVGRQAADAGLTVERLQPLQADVAGGLATLRMEVEGTGSIEALRNYLFALETAAPFIFVNRLRVSSNARAGEAEATGPLNVALQIEAFSWREGAP
jgi:hypothetical protein